MMHLVSVISFCIGAADIVFLLSCWFSIVYELILYYTTVCTIFQPLESWNLETFIYILFHLSRIYTLYEEKQ